MYLLGLSSVLNKVDLCEQVILWTQSGGISNTNKERVFKNSVAQIKSIIPVVSFPVVVVGKLIIPSYSKGGPTTYCSLRLLKLRPRPWASAVIGPFWVWCRHRSERPFVPSLGRWTLHLISIKGNLSVLHPACDHWTGILVLFRCQVFPCYFQNSCSRSLDCIFPCQPFFFPPCIEKETAAKSFEFQQRGLWGICSLLSLFLCLFFWIGWASLLERRAMGAPLSKTAGKAETASEKPTEAAASPTKTNGQVTDILTCISAHPSGFWDGVALRGRKSCLTVERLNGNLLCEFKTMERRGF